MQRRRFVLASAAAVLARPAGAAQTGSDLVLGQSAPLTGPLSPPVLAFNAGAQLAFDTLNAHGGVGGRHLRWITADDRGDPELAHAICDKLITEQNATTLFGCAGNMSMAAIEPLLRQHGVPALGGLWVADSVRQQCKGIAYFVRASLAQEAAALALHLATVGLQRMGVVHLATPFGQEGLNVLADAFAAQGLVLAGTAAVTPDGATAQEAARKLLALAPQAIVLFVNGSQAATVMATAAGLRRHPAFYGLSIVSDEDAIRRIGAQARGLAISQVVPYPWSESDRQIADYRDLASTAQVPIGYASFEGWLNAQVLIEALRRCNGDPSRARLHATLKVLQWYIAGMTVNFSRQELSGSRFVELVQLTASGRYLH
ncbi:ABC transporter substrate-binding protein [Sphaerotilus sp.]|jgi:branched-chain amino acid transport system substrate-binding protein|uniref:ABC transporter substrate-binding protein n=1 Tax=Sphaerotilus sp. TaxID=2093942 RepID=UPI00260032D6|nr:ABC transporter substrate-binding protein [Sphaerotilus sp.]